MGGTPPRSPLLSAGGGVVGAMPALGLGGIMGGGGGAHISPLAAANRKPRPVSKFEAQASSSTAAFQGQGRQLGGGSQGMT